MFYQIKCSIFAEDMCEAVNQRRKTLSFAFDYTLAFTYLCRQKSVAMEEMEKDKRFCIIMAGGIGSRFWPLSKVHKPKQFIDVLGTGQTLLQAAYQRAESVCRAENIYIVTSKLYKDLVKGNLPNCPEANILSEPERRNTAPCIAYAMGRITKRCKDAVVLVMPSDHLILDNDNFKEQTLKGFRFAAREDVLICMGIKTSYPNTGYGYIQYLDDVCAEGDCGIKKVKLFTEKPSLEMASRFVESGDFLWNAGIFIWSASAIGRAFERYLPEVADAMNRYSDLFATPDEAEALEKAYSFCPSISIDYAVMEKADNVYVIPSDFGWSDIGTWGALYEVSAKDENRNSIVGKNVMLYDCEDCMINVPETRLLVAQGLKGYIITESEGVVLLCPRDQEQRIKQFTTDVEIEKGNEYI